MIIFQNLLLNKYTYAWNLLLIIFNSNIILKILDIQHFI